MYPVTTMSRTSSPNDIAATASTVAATASGTGSSACIIRPYPSGFRTLASEPGEQRDAERRLQHRLDESIRHGHGSTVGTGAHRGVTSSAGGSDAVVGGAQVGRGRPRAARAASSSMGEATTSIRIVVMVTSEVDDAGRQW